MTVVEAYSFIGWGGIIWDGEAISAHLETGEATGVYITGVLGQVVYITILHIG